MKILSNDKISIGLGDRLCSSNFVVLLNLRRSPIVTSGANVVTGP